MLPEPVAGRNRSQWPGRSRNAVHGRVTRRKVDQNFSTAEEDTGSRPLEHSGVKEGVARKMA